MSQAKFSLNCYHIYLYVCMCVERKEVKLTRTHRWWLEKTHGDGLSLSLTWAQELNSSCLAWWQAPLHTEPTHWPTIFLFSCNFLTINIMSMYLFLYCRERKKEKIFVNHSQTWFCVPLILVLKQSQVDLVSSRLV